MSSQVATEGAHITIENIGGIDALSRDIHSGTTVLSGRNATNRTSFLQAIAAALGSDHGTLKSDAESGSVELTIDGETYTRTFKTRGRGVTSGGEPYLEDASTADLFAFLLERNEARQAVTQGRDLRELIMRPVDTEEIEAEINRLESERDDIEDQLETINELKGRLPGLEEDRNKVADEIQSQREKLEAKRAEIEEADADLDTTQQQKQQLEEKLNELQTLQNQLQTVRQNIDQAEDLISSHQSDKRELESELAELEVPDASVAELEREIAALQDDKEAVNATIHQLQEVIQFNETMMDSSASDIAEVFEPNSDSVSDQLLPDDQRTCWTCGSEVPISQIEDNIDHLSSLVSDKQSERSAITDKIESLQEKRQSIEAAQDRRERLRSQIDQKTQAIEDQQAELSQLKSQRDELSESVQTVEQEVEELESRDFSEILELHKEATEIEQEVSTLEAEREQIEDEIETIEAQISEEEALEEDLETLRSKLKSQRGLIDQIERDAINEFNDRMDDVLELLDYANLERIWLEQTVETVRQGRRKVDEKQFVMHVVRATDNGATYEDTISNLSQSEREVAGLVFALAGYLVHDLHEDVPFVLIDAIEMIDSQRIAALLDYFGGISDYLVVALLPNDAEAVADADVDAELIDV